MFIVTAGYKFFHTFIKVECDMEYISYRSIMIQEWIANSQVFIQIDAGSSFMGHSDGPKVTELEREIIQ